MNLYVFRIVNEETTTDILNGFVIADNDDNAKLSIIRKINYDAGVHIKDYNANFTFEMRNTGVAI